ncbi:MAG: endonuclease III [Dehalococcoidia bacterium]|nr:endonuclease III [Dehalococcoidia bacterium]
MPQGVTASSQVLPKRGRKKADPQEVLRLLRSQQGELEWARRYEPVDELMITILSQHTSDLNAERAYKALKAEFHSWDTAADADTVTIERAIRTAGLSKQKAPRIREVLRTIRERRGVLDLEFLKDLSLSEAKKWLQSLNGVGPKTAAVVLCFSFGLPAMAVDTHVYRVSRRLGLIGPKVNVGQAHILLEEMVPPEKVYPFHVYLIMHGRRICKAQRPLCESCVLNQICPSSLADAAATTQPKRDGKLTGQETAHGSRLHRD